MFETGAIAEYLCERFQPRPFGSYAGRTGADGVVGVDPFRRDGIGSIAAALTPAGNVGCATIPCRPIGDEG